MTQQDDIRNRLDILEDKESKREKKEIVREWLYTKCIWVWTLMLGWLFYAGIYIVDHYEKAALVMIAIFKALKESGK